MSKHIQGLTGHILDSCRRICPAVAARQLFVVVLQERVAVCWHATVHARELCCSCAGDLQMQSVASCRRLVLTGRPACITSQHHDVVVQAACSCDVHKHCDGSCKDSDNQGHGLLPWHCPACILTDFCRCSSMAVCPHPQPRQHASQAQEP